METFGSDPNPVYILWEIKNAQYCAPQSNKVIVSPTFCVPQFKNTSWYLVLYPCGAYKEYARNTSCYLYRCNDNGPDIVKISCELILSLINRKVRFVFAFSKGSGWGCNEFLPKPLSEYGRAWESIVITCTMNFKSSDLNNQLNSFERNSFVEKKNSESTEKSDENVSLPIKYFFRTNILYVTKSITEFIDDFIKGLSPELTTAVIFSDEYPRLIMTLESIRDLIRTKIDYTNIATTEPLLLICKISVKNDAGLILYSFKEHHAFNAGGFETEPFRLKSVMKKSFLKACLSDFSTTKLLLKGDFILSINDSVSKIIKVEYLDGHADIGNKFPESKFLLPEEISRLFVGNMLFDVALKVGKERINAHKVVLGAVSPRFASMFMNSINEKKACIVDIEDLDKETVKEMVSFIYTGSIIEWNFTRAKNLYSAANKYIIQPLQEVCRHVLIDYMNYDNIYEIVLIAYICNDTMLKEKAVSFIKSNISILSSHEWEKFEGKNSECANMVLNQILLSTNTND